MDLAEGGEPLCVVPTEEGVDALVGVYPKELAYDLDGEHLRVGKLRGGATLTEPTPSFELIVYRADDGDAEGVKVHNRRPPLRPVPLSQHRA